MIVCVIYRISAVEMVGEKEEKNVSWKIALQNERINMGQAKLYLEASKLVQT